MKTNKIRYIAFVIVTLIIIVTLTGCNYETEDSFEKVTTIATEKMEPIFELEGTPEIIYAQVVTSSDEKVLFPYIEKEESEISGYVTESVNFREEPNINSNVKEVLPAGTKILIKDLNVYPNNYYYCEVGESIGYISSDYVNIEKDILYSIEDTTIFFENYEYILPKNEKMEIYVTNNGIYTVDLERIVWYDESKVLSMAEYTEKLINDSNLELLTSFSTFYSHEEIYNTKAYNIDLCCSEINNTLILQGEQFNWHLLVGNTGKEEGYQLANIYSGGKVQKGYGGGVCQVASTLYNCVLELDLNVIERHPHGMPVYYVDYYAGKDATVDDIGGPNFIFENNLEYDIFIKAYTETIAENPINSQGKVTIEIYKVML